MMICSLCRADVGTGSFADLVAHGNVCPAVSKYNYLGTLSARTRAAHWLEHKADRSRLSVKRYRTRKALERFNAKAQTPG